MKKMKIATYSPNSAKFSDMFYVTLADFGYGVYPVAIVFIL